MLRACAASRASQKRIDSSPPFIRIMQGNLYGTTEHGGNNSCDRGCGTVFEITP
ncbi:MAG TPA: hypothetical protein VKR31_08230 [Rhizomicrobium sp.]|nr:hypothetical protein [Rhizomicrobium sp.]